MGKLLTAHPLHPILRQCKIKNLNVVDLANLMDLSTVSLYTYIKDPFKLNLRQLTLMAGIFGLSPEEFIYILLRNKPSVNDKGKWYIEDIRNKHK